MATSLEDSENLVNIGTLARNAAPIIGDGDNDRTVPSANRAHILVKALEDFMLPTIKACTMPLGINQGIRDVNDSGMSSEAQELLTALQNFIFSVMSPQQTQHGTIEKNIGTNLEAPEENLSLITKPISNINLSTTAISNDAYEQQLLKTVLGQAHHHVFNKMPIRLLAFASDGSGIELIERSEILDRISTSVRSNLANLSMSINHVRGDVRAEKKIIGDFVTNHAKYAILSHTWLHVSPGEVIYAEWKAIPRGVDEASPGYQKLANFCKVAATNHGVTFGWMDTVCINKESSSELDESIRSMFKWYRDASICVTYLAQTTALGEMRNDPWFTRGWTLQELLAPPYNKFYDKNWQKIVIDLEDDATDDLIRQEIQAATTISQDELNLFRESRHKLPISRRMQWAANRQVTREEDTAYSLMGILDVSISIAYGEDVVNWCVGPEPEREISSPSIYSSSLIPSSPKQYLWRAEENIFWFPLTAPITLTPLGLRLSVLLMPAIAVNPNSSDVEFSPIGDYFATVDIDAEDPVNPGNRLSCTYNLLDRTVQIVPEDWMTPTSSILLFGVLNFAETDTSITLPSSSPCLAVCLHSHTGSPVELIETSNIHKVHTSSVIVFDLKRSHPGIDSKLEKDSLEDHGMMLHTLHL
ncbi:hypothetical protein BJ912DRAFT_995726 [Pholiota molesta]|nr:hypothetical protein BJ912DRAFT_995726 [Pholiota molesta]